jgi:hypothetical protein
VERDGNSGLSTRWGGSSHRTSAVDQALSVVRVCAEWCQALISEDKVGQQVTLKILRDSQTMNVQVTLSNRPQNIAY